MNSVVLQSQAEFSSITEVKEYFFGEWQLITLDQGWGDITNFPTKAEDF